MLFPCPCYLVIPASAGNQRVGSRRLSTSPGPSRASVMLGRMFRLQVQLCLQFTLGNLSHPWSKTQSHFYHGEHRGIAEATQRLFPD